LLDGEFASDDHGRIVCKSVDGVRFGLEKQQVARPDSILCKGFIY